MRTLLSWITFPGVILHEYGHAWACRRLGIRVIKVCYLRFGNPLGYVLHEQPQSALQHILIAAAPVFVSTFAAFATSLAAALLLFFQVAGVAADMAVPAAAWLSFSFALHAFPSSGDADALWEDVSGNTVGFFGKTVLVPVVGLIRLVQLGNRFWLDALFAILLIAIPPLLLAVYTS
ncbi:MAG: DUF3267 domain-containing protein [Deltaproteobacteria bacterium]|nr:DUF3267 domain-containing protein [Deltaproteobacteria bacterium]